MKDYVCIKIECTPDIQEILMAIIDDPVIEVYEETEDALLCFLPKHELTPAKLSEINEQVESFNLSTEITSIPYVNWNETWEKNFHPIKIEDFVGIRAEFHPKFNDVEFDLVINPKMSFGTGHHETTSQMISLMKNKEWYGQNVLDYGCGTGILGILASKLGAKSVKGNDITEESIINTIENCKLNDVSNFEAINGVLEMYEGQKFDSILANINRNVLLDSASQLYDLLQKGGHLYISGYMPEDKKLIEDTYTSVGFEILEQTQKGYWLCHRLIKQ
ncbi:MAG: 50S ribosomal protein L11 methyltransferase [Saprospiraceae bacterium]|nr:50S ribosomal protein L11 methyltransferase [Saprospiraceae bacterium]